MKLVRFGEPGKEQPGCLDAQGGLRSLVGVIAEVGAGEIGSGALQALRNVDPASLPGVPADTRLGPCVAGVGKMVCVGLNYRDHAREANLPEPAEPILFLKAVSAITGARDAIAIPPGAQKVDWEVELGIVIGSKASYVREENALEHVFGYCVVNDVSERAYQMERGGQWDKGKCCDTFGPIGPWLVTRDEVPDPQALRLWLEVDGRRYQDGSTADMIFPVARIVSYVSQFMSLLPGDIIATGTPAGVGMGQKPPVYLRAGQTVRAGIDGLGVQVSPVAQAMTEPQVP